MAYVNQNSFVTQRQPSGAQVLSEKSLSVEETPDCNDPLDGPLMTKPVHQVSVDINSQNSFGHTVGAYVHFNVPRAFLRNIVLIFDSKLSKRVAILFIVGFIALLQLMSWLHQSNSQTLGAVIQVIMFDLSSLIVCLISVWVHRTERSSQYSFGFERLEVLSIFSCVMLSVFGSLFVFKESCEHLFLDSEKVQTGRLLYGGILTYLVHMILVYGVDNKALAHVTRVSHSSWLQVHSADVSRTICSFVPGLDKLLLPRLNPISLLGNLAVVVLIFTYMLMDSANSSSSPDMVGALTVALINVTTMLPFAIYTGKILLQTTPSYIVGQLDQCLREASTLDGVLEFRNEKFWTKSLGTLAGTVQVRVRRDADEQLVLAHVAHKLSSIVSDLCIQIVKDDWTQIIGGGPLSGPRVQVNTQSDAGHGHSHTNGDHGHSHGDPGHAHSHGADDHAHSHANGRSHVH